MALELELAAMVATDAPFAEAVVVDPSTWCWEDTEAADQLTTFEASLADCYAKEAAEIAEKRRLREARAAKTAALRRPLDHGPASKQLKSLNTAAKALKAKPSLSEKLLQPLGGGVLGAAASKRELPAKSFLLEENNTTASPASKSPNDTFTKKAEASSSAASEPPAARPAATFSVPKRAKTAKTAEPVAEPVWQSVDLPTAIATADINDPLPADGALALPMDESWNSALSEEPLELELGRFGPNGGNQTLLMRVTVEAEAPIWALNVAPADHDDGATLLYHFNPRRLERGGTLVQNDKFDDEWGRATKNALAGYPALFGLDMAELAIQLQPTRTAEGPAIRIVIAIDRRIVDTWTLRCAPPPSGSALALLVPTCDDFGNPESLLIHSAWWGSLPPLEVAAKSPRRR